MAQQKVQGEAEDLAAGQSELGPQLSPGEQWERYGRYPFLLAKLIFLSVLAAAVIWVLKILSPVVLPVFISLLIAYLLSPTVSTMEAKGVPRWAGILIILTGGLAFLSIFAVFLYPTIASQITRIIERLPKVLELIETRAIPWLGETFHVQVPETAAEAMEAYGEQIQDASLVVAERAAAWLQGTMTKAGALVMSLLNLVLIPIFTFYFLRDFNSGKAQLARFIPPWREVVVLDRLQRMDRAVGDWFRGQLQVATILAVLYALGLGIAYGVTGHDVQSGIVIGLLTGFTNIIPYVGFAVGSLLAFMVVLIEWTGWGAVIGVVIAFTIIQTFESYYLTPRIVGDKVGLSPVTVIIVLLVGGQVGGLLGMLLAIPIAGAIKVLIPDIIAWYQGSSIFTGRYSRPFVAMAGAGMGRLRVEQETAPSVEVEEEASPTEEEEAESAEEKKEAAAPAPEVKVEEEASPTEEEAGKGEIEAVQDKPQEEQRARGEPAEAVMKAEDEEL